MHQQQKLALEPFYATLEANAQLRDIEAVRILDATLGATTDPPLAKRVPHLLRTRVLDRGDKRAHSRDWTCIRDPSADADDPTGSATYGHVACGAVLAKGMYEQQHLREDDPCFSRADLEEHRRW